MSCPPPVDCQSFQVTGNVVAGYAHHPAASAASTVPISRLAYSASPEKNTALPSGFCDNRVKRLSLVTIHAHSSVSLSLDASWLTRVQQKSKPRNARREILDVACAEIPRALRLCVNWTRVPHQEQAQNGGKISAAKKTNATTLSIVYTLADDASGANLSPQQIPC